MNVVAGHSLFLGIDIGTSGTKAVLIDAEGRLHARAVAEYPLSAPRPLWSEQDPEDWWNAVKLTVRDVIKDAGIRNARIAGIGLTGQMHGLVALDARGAVLRPCILWNDQRASAECAALTARIGAERVLAITGKPVLPGFTLPKLEWMRAQEPELFARIAHVLLPKDYIRYRLSGTCFSDVSDASGTSLLDVGARAWSKELLDALDIPASWMPEVEESPVVTSFVSSAAAAETGLAAGTPIVGGAGDQAAEAVGSGVLAGDAVSVTIGTSGVVFAGSSTYTRDPAGRVHAYCHATPGLWHLMGVMLSAGGSLRWYRDTLGLPEKELARDHGIDAYELITEHAARAVPGCEGLLFLPYLTGERTPHPDPYARGAFVGITVRHGREHFARAVMEGVSFGLRDALELVRGLGLPVREVRLSGGGSRSDVWRQMLADVFGADVLTVNIIEGAAFGAALLAAVGAGAYATVQEAVAAVVTVTGSTSPGDAAEVYDACYPRYRALYGALKDEFRAMHEALPRMREA
jgi:xylulokinase